MSFDYALAGFAAALIVVYLLIALVRPEKF